ncbi:MAG: hypothetical protein CMM50_03590 [Rhodospirillaceae bacterium]|nr:hypothetical protein [Rhodospirillaceae bacterium]
MNDALANAISRERLRKYLSAQGDDLDAALGLYEQNMLLSEAFYIPLSCLEVCLRNKTHDRMVDMYGADWLTNAAAAPLNDFSRSLINEAIKGIHGPFSTGKLIAELKFGFWVGLFATQYDATLWRRALCRCFGAGSRRTRVHSRLNAIRRFRNRVAHHEPIFHRPVAQMHCEIIEAIGWMCVATRAWAEHHSRVPDVLNSN